MSKLSRINHMLGVAGAMKEIALDLTGDELYASEMFNLGLLHDIGRFIDNDNHEEAGANALKDYKYSEEIRYHGKLSDYKSTELNYLYLADMITGPNGEKLSIEERLEDIKDRYGEDSPEYKNSKDIVDYLSIELV